MDKNRIEGSIKEVAGSTKEAVGKALGDAKLVRDGKIEHAAGAVQKAAGEVADAVRDAVKKI